MHLLVQVPVSSVGGTNPLLQQIISYFASQREIEFERYAGLPVNQYQVNNIVPRPYKKRPRSFDRPSSLVQVNRGWITGRIPKREVSFLGICFRTLARDVSVNDGFP